MLVLSRKLNEKILLPCIAASVEVVAIRGNVVRIGIDAPPHVEILRAELLDRTKNPEQALAPAPQAAAALSREMVHALRNRLNVASLGLALLRKQNQLGLHDQLQTTIDKIEKELELLREQINGPADAPTPVRTVPERRARKALVVEDDQNERELLAAYLRMAGLDVEVASDGQAALDYLHTHERPDVVLMDMSLPLCDGPTAVREIRNDPAIADLRIFAVSGRTAEQVGEKEKVRVDRWFRKPLNAEDLLRDLHRDIHGEG